MPLNQIAFDFDSVPSLPKEVEQVPVAVIVEKNIDAAAEIVDLTTIDEVIIAAAPEEEEIVAAPKKAIATKSKTRGRMSLKEMEAGIDLIEIPEDAVLFEKMYYSIGLGCRYV